MSCIGGPKAATDVASSVQTCCVATDELVPPEAPGLPSVVVARIVTELGRRGDKVIACLRTAAVLIAQARSEDTGLRLAESAAYNLREALDAVVDGHVAADGGVGCVVDAWRRYELTVRAPGADSDAARAELDLVLERLDQDQGRHAFKTRKLLGYVRDLTGVEPLPGDDDPTVRYARLRAWANDTLHDDGTLSGVAALYDDVVSWFVRFFTPPDDRVDALVALAAQPHSDDLVGELRQLVLNSHHLGLFFSRLQDPSWLVPLHEVGLLTLPRDGEPWPFTQLVGASAIDPAHLAAMLDQLLGDSSHEAEPRRLGVAREILQNASRLGIAGHEVAGKVITKYPGDHWVHVIAVSIAKDADPSDPVQLVVADAVVGNETRTEGGYYTRTMLERLTNGLTTDNVVARVAMVAAKTRRLANDSQMRFVALDIAALPTEGDDLRDPVLILAQHLTTMTAEARDLGLQTYDLLGMVDAIPGELGQRIACQVLAGANDVSRDLKIRQIELRMASPTATGDDRDLIDDILATPLTPAELDRWRAAFGEPSPPPHADSGRAVLGDNWPRGWRWSMVLPAEVLVGWEEAVSAVSEEYGSPDPTTLDARVPRIAIGSGRSPYDGGDLSALPVLEAAALISAWRPSKDDVWGVSARELARTLEAMVKDNPRAWTEDAIAVVMNLREPVYVDHYFRAIAHEAANLTDRAKVVMGAVNVVRAEAWEPEAIGHDDYDYEFDWSVVDTVTVEMIAALANKDGELEADIDLCWELAIALLRALPVDMPEIDTDKDPAEFDDPLNRAINRPYGTGLEAVLALAGWEHRNQGAASVRLVDALDGVLAIPGAVGLELRAIVARSRPYLETVAREWLEARLSELFGTDQLGTWTFDLTLKWSRPTTWFYDRYQVELVAAARRGAEHGVSWLLIAYLWDQPGYTLSSIVSGLVADVAALKAAATEMASLLHGAKEDDPMVNRGLRFWEELLKADRGVIPPAVLVGLGRWTLVDAVDEDRWSDLMDVTLAITGGEIDMASEIAERCKEAQPSSRALRMLRALIGHGEPWERHHIETLGVEALREASKHATSVEFDLLRTRLIERGRHEAADVKPSYNA